jgi:hypothetical protein
MQAGGAYVPGNAPLMEPQHEWTFFRIIVDIISPLPLGNGRLTAQASEYGLPMDLKFGRLWGGGFDGGNTASYENEIVTAGLLSGSLGMGLDSFDIVPESGTQELPAQSGVSEHSQPSPSRPAVPDDGPCYTSGARHLVGMSCLPG